MSEKLRAKLAEWATISDSAAMLQNQWKRHEKSLGSALQHIATIYKYYALHERSHSEQILQNIEKILGGHGIAKLGATDVWLLLEASYWHDAGMLVRQEEISNLIETAK